MSILAKILKNSNKLIQLNANRIHTTSCLKKNEELELQTNEQEPPISYEKYKKKPLQSISQPEDFYYAKKITNFAKAGQMNEAIDVFFKEMIEIDRYKPNIFLYKVIIKYCVYSNNNEIAFEIFEQFKSHWQIYSQNPQMDKIMTLMFLACSNHKNGVEKIKYLREFMNEKGLVPNQKTYGSIIYAYGRNNALDEAFSMLEEMVKNKLKPGLSIFTNLLKACLSAKFGGFQHSLTVWQKLLETKKIKPTVVEYNGLLTSLTYTTYDPNMKKLIKPDSKKEPKRKILNENSSSNEEIIENSELKAFTNSTDVIDDKSVIQLTKEQVNVIDELAIVGQAINDKIKNLEWWEKLDNEQDLLDIMKPLAKFKPELQEQIKIREIKNVLVDPSIRLETCTVLVNDTNVDRLQLIGNAEGVLSAMKYHKAQPDIKTFLLLLQNLENNMYSENKLMDELKNFNLKLNSSFCNVLIKRRALRSDAEGIKEALHLMQINDIKPDEFTFGHLAYSVNDTEKLQQFLNDLNSFEFRLNTKTISTLISQGNKKLSYNYYISLFNYIERTNTTINSHIVNLIETLLNQTKKQIIEQEKQFSDELKNEANDDSKWYERANKFYNRLNKYFGNWIERNGRLISNEILNAEYSKLFTAPDFYNPKKTRVTSKIKK